MTCATETLSALLDGDLSPRETEKVQAHLQGCAACQAAFADLQTMREALRAEGEVELEGRDAWAELAARLGPSTPPRARFRWVWAPAVALACAAVIIGVREHRRPRGASDDQLIAQAEDEFRRADAQYQHAIDKLRTVAARSAGDSNRYQAAQAQLEAAVAECKKAARARPADADAEQLLFAAYRRQIDFYERQVLEARQ
jgi:anti-sigma factor RsiW